MEVCDPLRELVDWLEAALWLMLPRALSIQQKFRFETLETSRAQWSDTFRLHRPDPQQHTHNYALKEKSKYCLYPKEHSTVKKGRWKTKGGGILFRVESL